MPPIFDDYGDENNYSVKSAPTTIVPVVSANVWLTWEQTVLVRGE